MREIRPFKIISIIKPAGFGATKPLIVRAEDEKLYVLKTREDGTNPKDLGVFNETLAYLLHDEMGFGISPQNVCYLYIDDDVVDMVFDAYTQNIIEKESYAYIKDSKGFNVGVEYIEDAMEITSEKMNKTFVRDTIRLDNYILNCDRVEGANSNKMEEFLKRHNFDINSKMKTRKFNIVRYFPKVDTYEFLNVGVVVYDGDELHYRLLSANDISLLHCPILIESKVLKNSVEDLGDFLQGKYSSDEIILKINNRYKNVLDTSFQLSSKSEEPINELVHKLFYQYVGYKLERAEKETIAQKFEQKTKEIIAKDFSNKIEVRKSIISGFSLDFYNKKSSKIIHSLIGSINNSQDVFRAFQGVPFHISSGTEYDFLNAVNNANVENKEKLLRNGIKVFNYTSDDEVFEYCKQVLN